MSGSAPHGAGSVSRGARRGGGVRSATRAVLALRGIRSVLGLCGCRSVPAAAAAVAVALSVSGCGLGSGKAPSGVKLEITREFGARTVHSYSSPKVGGAETVMSLLMRNAKVSTRYGGGFVQSIDGVSGGQEEGHPVDWFYYVNGVEAEKGAAETEVLPGDSIWWDRHDWGVAEKIPAVVGSFPEPFLNGLEGKRLPVRVECPNPQSGPCHTVTSRLSKLGIVSAFAAIGPTGESPDTLQLLIGTEAQLRTVPAARSLELGPGSSGVYARMLGGGKALALLNAEGHVASTLGAGAGLIAATRYSSEAPAWIVTGTNEAGVRLAAKYFDAAALRNRFAIALAPPGSGGQSGGVIPLPVSGG